VSARRFVLALDQGTTGSTALVIDPDGGVRARGYAELPQHYPQPGWVEHDPAQIWATTVQALGQAVASSGVAPGELAPSKAEASLARALAEARGRSDAEGLAASFREIRELLAEGQAPERITAAIQAVRRRSAREAGGTA